MFFVDFDFYSLGRLLSRDRKACTQLAVWRNARECGTKTNKTDKKKIVKKIVGVLIYQKFLLLLQKICF